MARDRNAFRAGVFMLVSAGLVVTGVIAIAGSSQLFETWATRSVSFSLTDNLGGLRVGDDVRVGGVKVGQVKTIEIQPDQTPPRILVTFAMPGRYALKEDAVLIVESSVTGQSNLNIINLGSPDKPALADGAALTGRPSALASLFASLGEAGPKVNDILADVRAQTLPRVNATIDTYKKTGETFTETGQHATSLVDHVKTKVDPAIGKYDRAMDAGHDALANVRDLIGPANTDFKTSLKNVSDATGNIKEKLPGILAKVDESVAKVSTALDSAKAALEDVKKTAANARDATGSVKSILTGNRTKFDAMIASMKAAGDNLKFATAEVRRSPWRLLYKPAPNEMANLNIYDSARQFAEGANSLNDAAMTLRDALKDPDVQADDVKKLTEKLDETFANFKTVEAELWKQVKE